MKVYIVKYALTEGIFEAESVESFPGCIAVEKGSNRPSRKKYYHHGQWSRSKEEAKELAEKMRQKKINELEEKLADLKEFFEAELAKLRGMKFE